MKASPLSGWLFESPTELKPKGITRPKIEAVVKPVEPVALPAKLATPPRIALVNRYCKSCGGSGTLAIFDDLCGVYLLSPCLASDCRDGATRFHIPD